MQLKLVAQRTSMWTVQTPTTRRKNSIGNDEYFYNRGCRLSIASNFTSKTESICKNFIRPDVPDCRALSPISVHYPGFQNTVPDFITMSRISFFGTYSQSTLFISVPNHNLENLVTFPIRKSHLRETFKL